MALPDSWTNKPGGIPDYLETIKQAQPPERFSVKFLETLGYTSTNDRKFIAILKSLGFLDPDGKPTNRYYEYLDLSQSETVLAEAIRDAFSDLFAVNKDANKLSTEKVKNRLRTLYAGSKKDTVVNYIANTFTALVKCADFEAADSSVKPPPEPKIEKGGGEPSKQPPRTTLSSTNVPKLKVEGLQYHINIVLPESRDQAIYDAIFRALRDHLG